jgi:pimeloyl-ACP methyl ester carboxylesterase
VRTSLETLPGYRGLVQHLVSSFDGVVVDTWRPPAPVREDTDVLLFPYDFRRSVAAAAVRLDEAVSAALHSGDAAGGGRRVIVVAHSMGELVARYWAGVLGGWERCRALIMIGTPHRGAPKALDWVINGPGAGPVRFPGVTDVIRGWPSVYELLPQYDAVLAMAAGGGPGMPVELTELPAALLAARPELAGYAEQFAVMAAAGRRTHERIAAGWRDLDPALRPQVVSYLGRGHATLNPAVLDGGLTVSKADPPWRGNVGWRGDGTVPMLSAIPREHNDRPDLWRVLPDRQGKPQQQAQRGMPRQRDSQRRQQTGPGTAG